MTVKVSGKGYKIDAKAVELISHTQSEAENLVRDHLAEPIREMQKKGFGQTPAVLAYALLELAYFLLRRGRAPEQAEERFDILAHFAKKNIEQKMDIQTRKKQLH